MPLVEARADDPAGCATPAGLRGGLGGRPDAAAVSIPSSTESSESEEAASAAAAATELLCTVPVLLLSLPEQRLLLGPSLLAAGIILDEDVEVFEWLTALSASA